MKFIDSLSQWGCDTKDALERVNNDEVFLKTCLYMLVEDTNHKELVKSVRQLNMKQAFIHAHTIKGMLANLSLIPLVEKISPIVEKLRDGESVHIEAELKDFSTCYTDFIYFLKNHAEESN